MTCQRSDWVKQTRVSLARISMPYEEQCPSAKKDYLCPAVQLRTDVVDVRRVVVGMVEGEDSGGSLERATLTFHIHPKTHRRTLHRG